MGEEEHEQRIRLSETNGHTYRIRSDCQVDPRVSLCERRHVPTEWRESHSSAVMNVIFLKYCYGINVYIGDPAMVYYEK